VGVSNGALQFMAYEKMKSWAFERRRRRLDRLGHAWTMDDDKLVKTVLALVVYAHAHRKQRGLTTLS
jgi:solute carrier family 25 folate transporter 32